MTSPELTRAIQNGRLRDPVVPTLRQLRYFTALAEARHFGRAAQVCHVTQPALSMQIRELEAHLGVALVERGSNGVLLTREGQEIARRAHDILLAVQDLTDLARQSRHPLSGRVRIGVIPSVGPYLLPKLLPELRSVYPALELSLRESQTRYLLDDLVDGALDLLILALPVDRDDVETRLLFEDAFAIALPRQHRLAGRRDIQQAELTSENLLLLEEGHCLRDQALALCRTARTDEFKASSLATVVQMVAHGYGVTVLPELSLAVEVKNASGIAIVPFAPPTPKRQIGLAWRASSPHKKDFTAFGAFIGKQISRYPPWGGNRGTNR